MIRRKIVISFCNNIRHFSNKKSKVIRGSKVNEFGQVWTSLDEKNRKLKNCRKLT